MTKRIVLSSDHAAIDLRQAIARHIEAKGFTVDDIGPVTTESTHYPKHGEAAARKVASGEADLGIICCGTGQGIMMAANKVNANMLSLGARVVGEGLALSLVDAFLDTEFEGGRHGTRADMIDAIQG